MTEQISSADFGQLVPADAALAKLYGSSATILEEQRQRYRLLAERFATFFPGKSDIAFFSSPGRSEIIGNHTDHQNGKVMCTAVKMDIVCAAVKNDEMKIRLKSKGFDKIDVIDLSNLEIQEDEKEHSASLLRGIAARFNQLGLNIGGFDAYTESSVMTGSGLSSSAAFEILVATVLDHFYNDDRLSGLERAQISQYAENVYFGKPSGLMDQCGCGIGGFIYIDFADKEHPQVKQLHVDFDAAGYDLVITHPGGDHADLTDAYAAIPYEMRMVAEALGKKVLSEVSRDDFFKALPRLRKEVSDRAILRAMHYYSEQERVDQAYAALQKADFAAFFALLKASGLSSWMQLQNISPPNDSTEQPIALALAVSERLLGKNGINRVHGGGFAGTIQAFVAQEATEAYIAGMSKIFGDGAAVKVGIRDYGGIALANLE